MLDEKKSKEYRFKNIGEAIHYWRNKTKWPNEKKIQKILCVFKLHGTLTY